MHSMRQYRMITESRYIVNKQKTTSEVRITDNTLNYMFGKFAISVCKPTNDSISITINDKTRFSIYETTITNQQVSNIDITYKIMTKALEKVDNYRVVFNLGSGELVLRFDVLFDNILPYSEEVHVPEKLYGNEKQATLKIVEIKQKYDKKISQMEQTISQLQRVNENLQERLYCLENYEIELGYDRKTFSDDIIVHKLDNVINIQDVMLNNVVPQFFERLNLLQNATKMSLRVEQFYWFYVLNSVVMSTHNFNSGHTNAALTNKSDFMNKKYFANTIQPINTPYMFNVPPLYLPNITSLHIYKLDYFAIPQTLKSLPNITTLSFHGWKNDPIACFELIQFYGGLQIILFDDCANVASLDLIKNHCYNKGIAIFFNKNECDVV